jgi:hypothetical protein
MMGPLEILMLVIVLAIVIGMMMVIALAVRAFLNKASTRTGRDPQP